tara:strand:+ start:82 stop:519 length:438 start_codon:yes stop_codon:yes gene_type:complete
MKKTLIIFLLITACGYQPINIKKDIIFFDNVEFIGEKKINREISSIFPIKKEYNNLEKKEVIVKSTKNIIETSKNTKGQVSTFRTEISSKITILVNQKILKEKLFEKSFSYNNLDNKFDLKNYQKSIENNLIDEIIEEIAIFVSM